MNDGHFLRAKQPGEVCVVVGHCGKVADAAQRTIRNSDSGGELSIREVGMQRPDPVNGADRPRPAFHVDVHTANRGFDARRRERANESQRILGCQLNVCVEQENVC